MVQSELRFNMIDEQHITKHVKLSCHLRGSSVKLVVWNKALAPQQLNDRACVCRPAIGQLLFYVEIALVT